MKFYYKIMTWSKLMQFMVLLYGIVLLALSILVCNEPNSINIFTEVKINSTSVKTYEDTRKDETWTAIIAATIGITILSIFSTHIVIRYYASNFHQYNWDVRNVCVGIMLFWILCILSTIISAFALYEPRGNSINLARQQFQFQSQSPSKPNCTLYNVSPNISTGHCYTLMPGFNVTNNLVCCMNVVQSYYHIILSTSSIVGIAAVIIMPLYMFAYVALSFKNIW